MNWLRRVLSGRYGVDHLGRFTFICSVVFLLLQSFTRLYIFGVLALLLLGVGYFRMFSKNHSARYLENQKFLTLAQPMIKSAKRIWAYLKESRTHKHFKCKNCAQKIKVPRGRGKIEITCPKCRNHFVKKT